jgi:putative ABC transport system ATP-binding protein
MLKLETVSKKYRTTEVETSALNGVSLEIAAGEFVAIMGPSGCGKSTLLNILGLLDSPDGGAYWFFGQEVSKYSEQQLTLLRRTGVGFIFQSFNLIDDLNVAENVEVSLLYRRIGGGERRRRVGAALERVGIAHRAKHLPHQLSGGQQQRVAIARALVAEPKLILADEPTGNLDTENGTAVMGLLTEINQAGTTVVMVTHSLVHAGCAKRTIKLLDGRVVSETLLAA